MAAPLIPLYVIHIRGLKDFVPTTPQFNKKEMTYIVLILSHLKTLFGISRHSSFKVRFTCDQCDQMARLFPFVTMKIFAQRKNLFLNKVQQIAKYLPNPKILPKTYTILPNMATLPVGCNESATNIGIRVNYFENKSHGTNPRKFR